LHNLGVVVIGRNEGERLRQCLLSVVGSDRLIAYVDSGSTDDSVAFAQSLNVHVVELDPSIPFTAARARNEGLKHLRHIDPNIQFIQFVDGDCQVVAGWLDLAYNTLLTQPELAVVCGRRREQFPDRSIYNRLCDIEWATPAGEVKSCGGDAMMRVVAFEQVKGFNSTLIAGEEPELCMRLRQNGWKILRLDAEMTRHDANLTRFAQLWKRSLRAGYAYAEVTWLHRNDPNCHWFKASRSTWFWGLLLPIVAFAIALPTSGFSLLLLLGYPVLVYKIYRHTHQRGFDKKDAVFYALTCVVNKFSNVLGQLKFYINKRLRHQSTLIEYKDNNVVVS
jgi:glycosyltransferase involved in cell wall biosynthesis